MRSRENEGDGTENDFAAQPAKVRRTGRPASRKRNRASRLLLRSLRRMCPNCGQGRIFDSWFSMRTLCPACGLKLERNEESDYWVGGYLINFMIAEVIVAIAIMLAVLALWPEVPWNAVLYGTAAAAIAGPLVTYPFSKTLWLGVDLIFRPPEAPDFDAQARPEPTE